MRQQSEWLAPSSKVYDACVQSTQQLIRRWQHLGKEKWGEKELGTQPHEANGQG